MKLIIFGSQGSGKGTYASRISPILKIPHIATGEIMREEISKKTPLGQKVEQMIKEGRLVPDEIVIEIVKKRLQESDCENGFIFDGFPRTLEQAKALDKITKIDAVINLNVPEFIILERLSTRITCKDCMKIYNIRYLKPKKEGICDKCGGQLIQREDDTVEGIKKRLAIYKEQSAPLIKYYRDKGLVVDITNDKIDTPPEPIVNKILEELKKV